MDFTSMQSFICNKVSKVDSFSQARCLEYIKARHKLIYESYDWKAAQILVQKSVAAGAGTTTTMNVSEVHHILSVRLDGKLLDPVTPSLIFERETTDTDEYLTAGTPKYYEEFLDMTSQTRSIRFFPPMIDGNHTVIILGKTPYNDNWTTPAIPGTENALIAAATGDMWEYLHEVGKAQAKFGEAEKLLETAKALDTPGAQRPRHTRHLSAVGNALKDLESSVCMITGDFTPEGRNQVRDFIRRTYQQVWQAANWPETMIVDTPTVSNGLAIVTHLIDKVLAVRANVSTNLITANYQMLEYDDSSVILGVTPEAFAQVGTPLSYNMLLPLGLPLQLTAPVQLQMQFAGSETQTVTIRGESGDVDIYEQLSVGSGLATTVNSYDTIFTIQKPFSAFSLVVKDMSAVTQMILRPHESNRKYNQLQILPAYDTTLYPDRSIMVLGKRKLPQLLDDGDTTELTGIENILINSAAAKVFAMQGAMEKSAAFQKEADAGVTALISRVTTQQTYHPRILPYTEPDPQQIFGL